MQNRSFHVSDINENDCKCTKLKNAGAKPCFSLLNANFGPFCFFRSLGRLNTIMKTKTMNFSRRFDCHNKAPKVAVFLTQDQVHIADQMTKSPKRLKDQLFKFSYSVTQTNLNCGRLFSRYFME